MNALVSRVIDALYRGEPGRGRRSSLVRGICCLRPGVPGLSENIRVKSIVGRFLDTGRISASATATACRPRGQGVHLLRRLDAAQPGLARRAPGADREPHGAWAGPGPDHGREPEGRSESWDLPADGNYGAGAASADAFSAHEYFMTNPSLSGRGSALRRARVPPQLTVREA